MKKELPHNNHFLQLILPSEVFQYFELTRFEEKGKEVHLFLDEKNEISSGYRGKKLTSKGFHSESIIQDFPLRGKAMYLHVRRRKWIVDDTGQVVSNTFQLAAKGTRYSEGFAAFLKGLLGSSPS